MRLGRVGGGPERVDGQLATRLKVPGCRMTCPNSRLVQQVHTGSVPSLPFDAAGGEATHQVLLQGKKEAHYRHGDNDGASGKVAPLGGELAPLAPTIPKRSLHRALPALQTATAPSFLVGQSDLCPDGRAGPNSGAGRTHKTRGHI